MEILKYLFMGVVQGLTEFLPVSSSGHLVISETFLGINPPGIFLEVALHFASVIAIIIYLRKRLMSLISGLFKKDNRRNLSLKYLSAVVVSMIPAGCVALFIGDRVRALFENPSAVGISLVFTAGIVLAIPLMNSKRGGRKKIIDSFGTAIIVGCVVGLFQAIAMIPGISRSGSTIFAGVFIGLAVSDSADFSFIISIPAILGAVVMELGDTVKSVSDMNWLNLSIAFAFSLLTSLIALKWLYSTLKSGRVRYFGIYCLIMGIFVITYMAVFY